MRPGSNFLPKVQAGFRYVDRDASRRAGARYFNANNSGVFNIPITSVPLDYQMFNSAFHGDNHKPTPDTWLAPTFGACGTTSPTCGNSMSTSMCRAMGIRSSSIATPTTPILIRGATSTINEKCPAAYAQLNYDFDIGSVNVGGVLGMRGVKTKDHISGTLFSDQPDPLPTLIEPISVANSYTDWLPNANMNIRFSPRVDSCAWR